MSYAYLGSAFVDALGEVFEFIFETVLAPVLEDVLQIISNLFLNIIWDLLAELFLGLLIVLCTLIDFMESIFNVFAGIAPVLYQGKTLALVDVLFKLEAVNFAFWCITLASMAMCIIFTIVKTVKSISDMALEDRNPISKVLKDAMKAGVTFMMIPMLCLMMLQLSSAITAQAVYSFDTVQGGKASIGNIIFLTSTMDADWATTGDKDIVTGHVEMKPGRQPSFNDAVRSKYLKDPKRYQDLDVVLEDFNPDNVNYILGFISGAAMLFILIGVIVMFIRRMFELLLLYIISPLYVSTIPLDDGATFTKWREMFITKFFSGFGAIFAMRYYLLIIPNVAGSNLILYPRNVANGATINSILQLFLVVGGAWAVYKSQSLVMQILNPQAAQAEQQAASLLTGVVVGAVSTGAAAGAAIASGGTTAALGAVGAAGSALGGVASQKSQSGFGGGSSDQAYRG